MMRKRDTQETSDMARSAERQRAALRAFAKRAGYESMARWARDAGLANANSLYNFLNKRSEFLASQTLERLRRAVPGATLAEMLGETPARHAKIRVLPVRSEARAGAWVDTDPGMVDGLLPPIEIPIPSVPGLVVDEVVRLGDSHATEVYPEGSYLCIEHVANFRRPLEPGDRVLLSRSRSGRVENTIREVRADQHDADRLVLVTRSGQGDCSRTVPLPTPYDGQVWAAGPDRFQVRGRVSMASILEAADLVA